MLCTMFTWILTTASAAALIAYGMPLARQWAATPSVGPGVQRSAVKGNALADQLADSAAILTLPDILGSGASIPIPNVDGMVRQAMGDMDDAAQLVKQCMPPLEHVA